MRKLHLAIVPILAVLVAAYVMFPRATPRPAEKEACASQPACGYLPSLRTGAPSERSGLKSEVPDAAVPVPVLTGGGAPTPRPSGGIGQPTSYCKPKFCETPKPVAVDGIVGTATYYCRPGISRCTRGYPDGMYAAAGPEIRAMLGDWRGREVIVTDAIGNVAVVRLIDFCACGGDHVIDLYWTAFSGIVNPVTVTVP